MDRDLRIRPRAHDAIMHISIHAERQTHMRPKKVLSDFLDVGCIGITFDPTAVDRLYVDGQGNIGGVFYEIGVGIPLGRLPAVC